MSTKEKESEITKAKRIRIGRLRQIERFDEFLSTQKVRAGNKLGDALVQWMDDEVEQIYQEGLQERKAAR